jgi:hypothetical protein
MCEVLRKTVFRKTPILSHSYEWIKIMSKILSQVGYHWGVERFNYPSELNMNHFALSGHILCKQNIY